MPRGPGLQHRRHVGDQLGGRQQLEALGVGLHQAVLDAVVHHLREVPGADRAGVREALLARPLRAQRVEDRHRQLDVLGARRRPSGRSRCPCPRRRRRRRRRGSRCPSRRAARRSARRRCSGSCRRRSPGRRLDSTSASERHGGAGRLAGGHHHPHHARRGQRVGQRGQRVDVGDRRGAGRSRRPRDRPARSRSRMLPPILPRPMSPSCTVALLRACVVTAGSAGEADGHQQMQVAGHRCRAGSSPRRRRPRAPPAPAGPARAGSAW